MSEKHVEEFYSKDTIQIDDRLNPDIIREGLLEEFNNIKREKDDFTIEVNLDSEDPIDGTHEYII